MKKIILLPLVISLFFSCEKDANVKVPPVDPVPVITAFLSPEDYDVVVRLYWSDPVFSEGPNDGDLISDATVTISDGTIQAVLPFDAADEWYTADTAVFVIQPGKTYTVNVVTAGGILAHASTFIPVNYAASLSSFEQERHLADSSGSNVYYTVYGDLEWPDLPGETNYYSVTIYSLAYNISTGDTTEQLQFDYLYNDAGNDGGVLHHAFGFSTHDYVNVYSAIGTRVILSTVNKDYYEYHRTVQAANYSDPFSEPGLIYSNVNGGLGVVSGYRLKVFDYFY